mmetsp:Transcript_32944/g.57741  ORF Transcript_32944/g.57741 Transcript_32944/m.57741 type:complete len:118 (-) Transcript_32944:342-695(-)
MAARFQEGLCTCYNDTFSCICVLVPFGVCFLQSKAIALLHQNDAYCLPFLRPLICCCYGAAWNRHEVREEIKIEGDYCSDLLVHMFCPCCATTQEYREVKRRSMQMSHILSARMITG